MIAYVIASDNYLNGGSELVRLIDGKIVSRSQLGSCVCYGASNKTIVAVGFHEGAFRVRSWNMATGAELSNSKLADSSVALPRKFVGAAAGFIVLEPPNQVLFAGHRTENPKQGVRQRRAAAGETATAYGSIALKTGKIFQLSRPEIAKVPLEFRRLKSQWGIRLEDGSFSGYDPDNYELLAPISFSGIAAKWSYYLAGLGLATTVRDRIHLLSDVDCHALPEPKIIADYGGQFQWLCRDVSGEAIAVFAAPLAGTGKTEVTVRRIDDDSVVFRLTEQIDMTGWSVAPDGHAWLITNRTARRAIFYDRTSDRSLVIDYRWTKMAEVIPFFGRDGDE